MRIIGLLIVLISIIGCGSDPLIANGKYDVKMIVEMTNDPFIVEGDEIFTQWKLRENDGYYTLNLGGDAKLHGAEYLDRLNFLFEDTNTDNPDCLFTATLGAVLLPVDTGFTGSAYQDLLFCSYWNPNTQEKRIVNWTTQFSVETVE